MARQMTPCFVRLQVGSSLLAPLSINCLVDHRQLGAMQAALLMMRSVCTVQVSLHTATFRHVQNLQVTCVQE